MISKDNYVGWIDVMIICCDIIISQLNLHN